MQAPVCTQQYCGANACCNSCGASLRIWDEESLTRGIDLVKDSGGSFSCHGNSCDYTNNCDLDPGYRYVVTGVFHNDAHFPRITVQGIYKSLPHVL